MSALLSTIIILVLLTIQACTPARNEEKITNIMEDVLEEHYPWRESSTKAAIDAIFLSISNLTNPTGSLNENFPSDPGPYNTPFTQSEIEELVIVGYNYSDKEPDIYEIEFRPEGIECCDNRITVRMNIKTNEVFMVFMKPDS